MVPTVDRELGRPAPLLQRDGRRQPGDLLHVRGADLLQQPPGVRRDRLEVAALRLGVQRAEGERGLAGAGDAGEGDQRVAGEVDVDVRAGCARWRPGRGRSGRSRRWSPAPTTRHVRAANTGRRVDPLGAARGRRRSPVAEAGMSWDHLISWALQGGPAPVQLTDASVARIAVAEEQLRLAGRSGAVYGLTTGVGALRHVPRSDPVPDDGSSPGLRLWRSHATGIGETYDDASARAGMAIRLHQITSGRSGVSSGLASSLGAAVASGAVPDLHQSGSIGTGDLVPLAELALTLIGERPWRSGSAPIASGRRRGRPAVHVEQRDDPRSRGPGAPPDGEPVHRRGEGRRPVARSAAGLARALRPAGARPPTGRVPAAGRGTDQGPALGGALGPRPGCRTRSPCAPSPRCMRPSWTPCRPWSSRS